jgi:hypothetical protein
MALETLLASRMFSARTCSGEVKSGVTDKDMRQNWNMGRFPFR